MIVELNEREYNTLKKVLSEAKKMNELFDNFGGFAGKIKKLNKYAKNKLDEMDAQGTQRNGIYPFYEDLFNSTNVWLNTPKHRNADVCNITFNEYKKYRRKQSEYFDDDAKFYISQADYINKIGSSMGLTAKKGQFSVNVYEA